MTGIERAVAQAGSQEALAQGVGVQQPAVSKWVARGWVSYRKVGAVAEFTGVGARSLLNPRLRHLVGVE